MYVRTATKTSHDIGQKVKSQPPRAVYEDLLLNNDDIDAPRSNKQIRNKKYNDKQKAKHALNKTHTNSQHFADNILTITNLVQDHPFVQYVEHSKSKVPSVILYTQNIITQMKLACASLAQSSLESIGHLTSGRFL